MNQQNRMVSAIAGYVLDVFRLSRMQPINLHSYAKFLALRRLQERTKATCIIETGTFLGVTAARCARVFRRVYTIELDPGLAARAAHFLARYPQVEVLQGDALHWLPVLLQRDDVENVEVFLDGHFSGPGTASADAPEPALPALDILARFRHKIAGILIDDFRLFGTEQGFPSKKDLLDSIERGFPYPDWDVTVHADQVVIARVSGA